MTTAIVFMGAFIIVVVAGMLISKQRRDAAWKQFAGEVGAEFIEGGFFSPSKVQVHFKEWIITLDTFSAGDTLYTRMKTPLQNKDGFQFTVFRTGLVSQLDKALGSQHIGLGDLEFDRDYVVQGNNESKVRALFANQRIRQLIQTQKAIRLGIRENNLRFEAQGFIKDVERLKSILELMKVTLNQLQSN